jgi:hypothetical protein
MEEDYNRCSAIQVLQEQSVSEDAIKIFYSYSRAPSEARLYRLGVSPSSRSPGKALDIECCVGVGNDFGEAYTERWRAAMRKREGIEPRYCNKPWVPTC